MMHTYRGDGQYEACPWHLCPLAPHLPLPNIRFAVFEPKPAPPWKKKLALGAAPGLSEDRVGDFERRAVYRYSKRRIGTMMNAGAQQAAMVRCVHMSEAQGHLASANEREPLCGGNFVAHRESTQRVPEDLWREFRGSP